VLERLAVYIRLIAPVEAEEKKLTEVIEQVGGQVKTPKGIGALGFEVLRREIGDWSRFNNRPPGFQLHRAMSARIHQRGQTTWGQRQQER
jgi:hypothetical protein